MNEPEKTLITELLTWNWSGIIQSIAAFITVAIAYLALSSWKNQHKTQKITSFLDELTESIHEYVRLINIPVQHLQFIKIQIDSYKSNSTLDEELKFPEAVMFIKSKGKEESKNLLDSLNPCDKSLNKIHSLIVKGQVWNINDYGRCQEACMLMIKQYERLQAVSSIIGNPNLNWKNEKVEKTLESILEVTPEDIEYQLNKNQIAFITFVKKTYEKVYKNT